MSRQSTHRKTIVDEFIKKNKIDLESFIQTNSKSLRDGDTVMYFSIREIPSGGITVAYKTCIFGGKTQTGKYAFYYVKNPTTKWYISRNSIITYIIYRQYRIKELTEAITRLNKKYSKLDDKLNSLMGQRKSYY